MPYLKLITDKSSLTPGEFIFAFVKPDTSRELIRTVMQFVPCFDLTHRGQKMIGTHKDPWCIQWYKAGGGTKNGQEADGELSEASVREMRKAILTSLGAEYQNALRRQHCEYMLSTVDGESRRSIFQAVMDEDETEWVPHIITDNFFPLGLRVIGVQWWDEKSFQVMFKD